MKVHVCVFMYVYLWDDQSCNYTIFFSCSEPLHTALLILHTALLTAPAPPQHTPAVSHSLTVDSTSD